MIDLALPLLIAGLVVVEVALWQLRIALSSRSYRVAAAIVGGLDAVVYIVALGQLVTHLDNPLNVAGYAAGVVVGVFLGSLAGDRLAAGQKEVRIVLEENGSPVIGALRKEGWPLTAMTGDGLSGPVTIAFVAVDGAHVGRVTELVTRLAPSAFWTVEQLNDLRSVRLPRGFIQAGTRSRRLLSLHARS